MDQDDDFVQFVPATWTRLYRIAYLLANEDRSSPDSCAAAQVGGSYAW